MLFQCMIIAIFDDMCRNLECRGRPKGVDPPSPLRKAVETIANPPC